MKNKRSAMLTAGGLAASFMAGAAAVTFHWGMGTSSASTTVAAPPGAVDPPKPLKPIVKHRTIVIHRKAPSPPAASTGPAPAAQTVVVPAPAPASTTTKSVTTTGGSPTAGGENDHEHEGSDN